MKRNATLYARLFAIVVAFPLGAQQVSAQIATILKSSLAAQAGHTVIQDVTLTGLAKNVAGADEETVPFTFLATASGSSRTELNLSTGRLREIRQVDASGARGVWSQGSEQHAMVGHNIMTDAAWYCPVLIVERLLTDPNAVVSFVGIENGLAHFRAVQNVSGNLTQAVAGQIQHLSQVDLYLDFNSLLPKQLSFWIHPDKNALTDIPVTIQYSAYRTANGATVPTRVQKFINSTLMLDIEIQNVALNTGLPQADFTW